ncbi:MAG TPA: HAD hydrolase-like protein [Thermoplasmata archaeon]|nr:HAD hydrolase-like protein [Thermoplasmata archaeon]
MNTPSAFLFDVWYTLLYLPNGPRRAVEASRRRAWVDALERSGLDVPSATARAHELTVEIARREPLGDPFPLSAQAAWAIPNGRVDLPRLESALARGIEAAPVRVAPGCLRLLEGLRNEAIPTALVSNVVHEPPEAIHRILRRCGIASQVDVIVLSSEVGAAKPDPRPMRIALERLKTSAGGSLHLGDTDLDLVAAWRAGVPAARYVGLRRFWPGSPIPMRGPPRLPAPTVESWARLRSTLPRLWPRAQRAAARFVQASA